MKKHVLIWLTLMLLCFIAGGFYIVTSIQEVTSNLGNAAAFNQVEFLRQDLENNIRIIQSNLLLQGSPHALDVDSSIALIETMEDSASICLSCHHSDEMTEKLGEMEVDVERYMQLLSRTITFQDNATQRELLRTRAFSQGDLLLKEVKSLSVASADKISMRIAGINSDINLTKEFLVLCLILGPIAIFVITVFFLKRFTGSIGVLVAAAQTLESGDLDYRITDRLKDEFGTLANSFNGMAASLQDEQQKFQSVSKLYRTLFESAGDAIMITELGGDSAGRIVSANRAASDLYGYSIDELQGMNVISLVPDNKVAQFQERMQTVAHEGWSRTNVKRKRKDGTLIPLDLSIGPLELDERRYLLCFCKDISDRLKAEEELQRANQMALVGQMSAGLAHEIKNPLAGIKVSLDVLSDELELLPEDRELFARIINEINRMEKLLKSLLNYARPPQPQFDLVDMNRLLDNSLKHVEVAARSHGDLVVHLAREFSAQLPQVEADSSQMQQVFLNILLNAVDALETEGTISIATRMDEEDRIRIAITDSGTGMSEEALDKIFNPFFTTKTKGTGLGLAICKRLVEQHCGQIFVESKVGCGTSFVITLPQVQQNRE
jgi:two-component system, NtrC family, sensor histidine kinase AtoS